MKQRHTGLGDSSERWITRSAAGAAVLLLCLSSLSCSKRSVKEPVSMTPARAASPPQVQVPVSVASAGRQTLEEKIELVGILQAERKVTVGAEIGGRVVSVAVREGDTVSAGQTLIALLDEDARLRVAAAEAELSVARQRSKGADSEVAITRTDTQLNEAQAQQQVRVAQAGLEQAKLELQLTQDRVEGEIALAQAELSAAEAKLRLLLAGSRPQEIERARAEVDGAKMGIASAERAAVQAEREWRRKSDLASRGYLPRQEAENAEDDWHQAKLSVQLAQSRQRTLQQALDVLEAGARREELDQARAQVRAAEERVAAAEKARGTLKQKAQAVVIAEANLAGAQRARDAARHGTTRVLRSKQESQAVHSATAQAEAGLRLARQELSKTRITAPTAGVVTTRQVEPGATVLPGQALMEIADLSSLYLDATIAEGDISRIRPGQGVTIRFDALGGMICRGSVREVIPPADGRERSFRVKVAVPGENKTLRVGMLATGMIAVGQHADVLTIPTAALIGDTPGARQGEVYVVEQGTAHRQRIALGLRAGKQVVVTGGLRVGSQVVVEGQRMLAEGRHVDARPVDDQREDSRHAAPPLGQAGRLED